MSAFREYTQKPSWRLQLPKYFIAATTLVFLITACQAPPATPTTLPYFPTYTFSPQASATSTKPVPLITVNPSITFPTSLPMQSPTSVATRVAGSVQFETPTQGITPTAMWRPPLYPTPWAPTQYDHFYFASPIAADEINTPVSDYRYGGVFFEDVVHTGIDIPAPKGTPIHAAGPGTIVWAGYGVFLGGYDPKDPYGLAVTIRHDFGYQDQALYTIYGHMEEVNAVVGQHVDTGDLIGWVGETGKVTGPHLHFEVRLGENSFFTTRNPELWLVPPIGWGIIAGRMMDTAGQLIYNQQIIITDPQIKQNWFAWSYAKTTVNSDKYYQENLVIGDLPAGNYILRTDFAGASFSAPIEVYPGMVNYFTFNGFNGFSIGFPSAPAANFTPAPFETPIP